MSTKLNWNSEQQQVLKKIVQSRRNLTWNEIAEEMNKQFPDKSRTGKQYRERYVNYVQFEQQEAKNTSWTVEEEDLLFRCYREMGTKWTLIAKIIPSKSENSLKNKFYGALRKTLRKINRIGKQNIKKFNKFIRYESLIRIMDAAEGGEDLPAQIKGNSMEIKKRILDMAQHCETQFEAGIVGQTIKKIHHFNIATRCYSAKKWKRCYIQGSEVKQEECEDQSNNSGQKSLKWSQNTNDGVQRQRKEGGERRLSRENIEYAKCPSAGAMEVGQMEEADNQVEVAGARKMNVENIIANDLEFELCGILHENYVPQFFNYFQQ